MPGRRLPYPVHVLGAGWLEVEVARSLVAARLEDVDGPESAPSVAGAEAEVLVVPRPVLTVEVDVEELSMPERLSQAVGVVEPRQLLVTDLWVEPDHFGVLELIDEGQRVSDGGEKDVPARLVGLGLDGDLSL
jgi:hypothetical protein